MNPTSSTKAKARVKWMGTFEAVVVKAEPAHAGRIEWPTAHHWYFSGYTAQEADEKYLAAKKISQAL